MVIKELNCSIKILLHVPLIYLTAGGSCGGGNEMYQPFTETSEAQVIFLEPALKLLERKREKSQFLPSCRGHVPRLLGAGIMVTSLVGGSVTSLAL